MLRTNLVLACALTLTASTSPAIVINSIRAPASMFRPTDNALYTFPVRVTVTINGNEAALGTSINVYFRDTMPFGPPPIDPLIDGITLNVPPQAFGAGKRLVANFNLAVGCDNQVAGGRTFGQLTAGTTGNAVSICDFVVPGVGPVVPGFGPSPLFFGTNRVECVAPNAPATNSNPIVEMPNRNIPPSGSEFPNFVPPNQSGTFSLTCLGDFDQNGFITVGDIFAFLTAFFAQDQNADADGSGSVSVQDIFVFLTAWFSHCA